LDPSPYHLGWYLWDSISTNHWQSHDYKTGFESRPLDSTPLNPALKLLLQSSQLEWQAVPHPQRPASYTWVLMRFTNPDDEIAYRLAYE
jgi:hypothetical protein